MRAGGPPRGARGAAASALPRRSEEFRNAPLRTFDASFRLIYVNSAATKALRRLFGLLHAMAEHGISVTVTWEHDPHDDVAADLGEDLAAGLPRLDYRPRPVHEALVS